MVDADISIIPQVLIGTRVSEIYPTRKDELVALEYFVPIAIRYKYSLENPWVLDANTYFEKAILRFAEYLNSEIFDLIEKYGNLKM